MKRFSWSYSSIVYGMIFFTVSLAFANETNTRTYSLPDHGSLQLQVPLSWADRIRQPSDQLPLTITFSQKTGKPFEVRLTPSWPVNEESILPDSDKLRQLVQQSADQVRGQAIEKSIKVIEIKGTSGVGFYFLATDRAPKKKEYKYMIQGIIPIDEVLTTFAILTNEGQKDIVSNALTMLKTARHTKQI